MFVDDSFGGEPKNFGYAQQSPAVDGLTEEMLRFAQHRGRTAKSIAARFSASRILAAMSVVLIACASSSQLSSAREQKTSDAVMNNRAEAKRSASPSSDASDSVAIDDPTVQSPARMDATGRVGSRSPKRERVWAPAGATLAAKAPKISVTRADTRRIEIGTPAELALAISMTGTDSAWHFNPEYPTQVAIEASQSLGLDAIVLEGAALRYPNEKQISFDVDVHPLRPGEESVLIRISSALCEASSCIPIEEFVSVLVHVNEERVP